MANAGSATAMAIARPKAETISPIRPVLRDFAGVCNTRETLLSRWVPRSDRAFAELVRGHNFLPKHHYATIPLLKLYYFLTNTLSLLARRQTRAVVKLLSAVPKAER